MAINSTNWTSGTINSTKYTDGSTNSTDYTKGSINSTDYTDGSINSTNYSDGVVYILMNSTSVLLGSTIYDMRGLLEGTNLNYPADWT